MSKADIYEQLKPHTGTSRGLGIPDEDTHQDRLMVCASLLRKHGASSLLDVGCGYGDLRMHVWGCEYLGIDVHDWMLDEARSRLPTTKFKHVELAQFDPQPLRFDAVAALGVLSTIAPSGVPAFMQTLSKHASRLMVVSFMPIKPGYTGVFQQHDVAAVVGHFPVVDTVESHGETTILMGLGQ